MAASMMFAFARNFSKNWRISASLVRYNSICGQRYLLTAAYQCNELWKERLGDSMLQFDTTDYLVQLSEKADKGGGITGVDVHLLAHKLGDCDGTQLETVKQLLHKHRHSQHALDSLESTAYTLARSYTEIDQTDDLIDMLQDKVNYGIFLEPYGASFLMDHFIKNENYLDASRVAYELMLQEELDHALTSTLALYACTMNLANPVQVEAEEEPETQQDEDDDVVTYMRVPFIRNPHYDDHFDLVDENLLLGKTLASLGHSLGREVGLSSELVGWAYYEKFHRGLDVLKRCSDGDGRLAEEALNTYKTKLTETEVVEPEEAEKPGHPTKLTQEKKDQYLAEFETLSDSLRHADKLISQPLTDLVTDHVTSRLAQIEPEQIQLHQQQINEWTELRQRKYQEQCVLEAHQKRKAEIIEQLKAMKEKEELLNYFDLKDEIELAKSQAPKRKETEEEEKIEQSVLNLLRDPNRRTRVRKERDNRRDHKKENRERYIAMKKIENRLR